MGPEHILLGAGHWFSDCQLCWHRFPRSAHWLVCYARGAEREDLWNRQRGQGLAEKGGATEGAGGSAERELRLQGPEMEGHSIVMCL